MPGQRWSVLRRIRGVRELGTTALLSFVVANVLVPAAHLAGHQDDHEHGRHARELRRAIAALSASAHAEAHARGQAHTHDPGEHTHHPPTHGEGAQEHLQALLADAPARPPPPTRPPLPLTPPPPVAPVFDPPDLQLPENAQAPPAA